MDGHGLRAEKEAVRRRPEKERQEKNENKEEKKGKRKRRKEKLWKENVMTTLINTSIRILRAADGETEKF